MAAPNPFIFEFSRKGSNGLAPSTAKERRRRRISPLSFLFGASVCANIFFVVRSHSGLMSSTTIEPEDFHLPPARETKGPDRTASFVANPPPLEREAEQPPKFTSTADRAATFVANQPRQDSNRPEKCTASQLAMILKQLPAEDCEKGQKAPWLQKCSFNYATKCPDAVWVEDFYTKLRHFGQDSNAGRPFLGLFIGCNKGMDAIDVMRMGSGDPFFDKEKWKEAMSDGGKNKLGDGVCNQVNTPQFALQANTTKASSYEMHCIEPSPQTYAALSQSARHLHYDRRGFKVVNAAMSLYDGHAVFPNTTVGKENRGLDHCDEESDDPYACANITMYSLETYVNHHVPPDVPINLLSVDVEGFDMDVLRGGNKTALSRVEYLEFEYNWMGTWKEQKLSTLIHMLDELGFTCYWPGFQNRVWRITGCWLDHYDLHFWSNVACVNRNMDGAKEIAESLETLFVYTLSKGNGAVMNFKNRYRTPKVIEQENRKDLDGWCRKCRWNRRTSCQHRLEFVVSKYDMNYTKAQSLLMDQTPQCAGKPAADELGF